MLTENARNMQATCDFMSPVALKTEAVERVELINSCWLCETAVKKKWLWCRRAFRRERCLAALLMKDIDIARADQSRAGRRTPARAVSHGRNSISLLSASQSHLLTARSRTNQIRRHTGLRDFFAFVFSTLASNRGRIQQLKAIAYTQNFT